nr:MAG TPA: N-6 DNA Methylase [Caudoviricetes sp.]
MTKEEVFKIFHIEDLRDLPDAVMRILDGSVELRNKIYNELIRMNDYDMSYDWFQGLYENELSERKQKKQDFTPNSLGILCSKLTSQAGPIHEPTAGNGSMIIADWWQRCHNKIPWEHFPSQNMVTCWELSARSIPILLLNLSIRGIMGYVYHGDVLEKSIKMKYILLNRKDDTLGFSDIIKDPEHKLIIKSNIQ